MKKIVLIPDSFKGTMSSAEICTIMKEEINKVYPGIIVDCIPVADGGEGSVHCFLEALTGKLVYKEVAGPFFEKTQSFYGIIENGSAAVIEMAACAGLPMAEGRLNPLITTTYGLGELFEDAARNNAKKIIVGLGGSATNDGGCGAAVASGIKFINKKNESFIPTGGSLMDICHIDMSAFSPSLKNIEMIAMCDIDNPLCGENGAARVFGPQKGADAAMIIKLDEGLLHLSKIIERDIGTEVLNYPGSGAAGGLGAGMRAFFGAKVQMGIETVLDTVQFEKRIQNADLIITGEGKLDRQSLRGKVVIGVAKRAKGIPVVAVVGDIGDDIEETYGFGVSGIFSINRVALEFKDAKRRARLDMALTIRNLMRFIKSVV